MSTKGAPVKYHSPFIVINPLVVALFKQYTHWGLHIHAYISLHAYIIYRIWSLFVMVQSPMRHQAAGLAADRQAVGQYGEPWHEASIWANPFGGAWSFFGLLEKDTDRTRLNFKRTESIAWNY